MINPDFANLANAMGGRGLSVEHEKHLVEVLEDFLFTQPDIPALLDAHCEKDTHVYPMVPTGHGLDSVITRRPAKAQ